MHTWESLHYKIIKSVCGVCVKVSYLPAPPIFVKTGSVISLELHQVA